MTQDRLFVIVQAHEGRVYQAQVAVDRMMLEDANSDLESYAWDQLDRDILRACGHVSEHRLRLAWDGERKFGDFRADFLRLGQRDEMYLLDGPLAGKWLPPPGDGLYTRHMNGGNIETYERTTVGPSYSVVWVGVHKTTEVDLMAMGWGAPKVSTTPRPVPRHTLRSASLRMID